MPISVIEKVINRYITGTQSSHYPWDSLPTTDFTHVYFKLPYICHFSAITKKKIRHFIERYCNDLDIKLVFSSFKIGSLFGVKDPVPDGLCSRVVYKFVCISLYVLAVMLVTWARRAGISPRLLEST